MLVKTVQVSFKAKVKVGITFDALLATYPNESKDKPSGTKYLLATSLTIILILRKNQNQLQLPPPTTTQSLRRK